MDKMETEKKESIAITNWMIRRIKKGLGVNAIVVGPPGLGKSYCCLRIMEIIYKELFNKKLTSAKHIVNDIPEAFNFVRHVNRPGEPLTIEEVSVLAGSRRSMSTDNVSLNILLDTCRKKQVILLMNAPHIKAVDTHIKRMSHLMIECLRINKKQEFVTTKALKLQSNQHSGKVYLHRFTNEKNRPVHRSYFYKPNEELINNYEETKDIFMGELYALMEAKGNKKKETIRKEAGIKEKRVVIKTPSEIEMRRFSMYQQGLTMKQIALREKCSVNSVSQTLKRFQKKTQITPNLLVNTPNS